MRSLGWLQTHYDVKHDIEFLIPLLHFLSSGITRVCHHDWFMWYWGSTLDFVLLITELLSKPPFFLFYTNYYLESGH